MLNDEQMTERMSRLPTFVSPLMCPLMSSCLCVAPPPPPAPPALFPVALLALHELLT